MKPPRRLRRDTDAVSEVIGTILILGMTVSLFAVIIIWVASFPTPAADVRLELDGTLIPLKDANNNWAGVNITITHRGGELLGYAGTRIYLTIMKSTGARTVEILRTVGTITWGPNAGQPYGLIDGRDKDWSISERWSIANKTVAPTDKIRAEVVDVLRSVILWGEDILGPAGSHPPLFLEKWADGDPETFATADPVMTLEPFVIYARVSDEDGNLQSVNATMTIFYGTPDACKTPQRMYDDGTNGDPIKGDGIWTLKRECMVPQNLSWDGSIVLFSATDGTFVTTSRMVLSVRLGRLGEQNFPNSNLSGRPPNLRYNGLQGYNIFNASQWDAKEFQAKETRTFKGNERVVVVVGSLLLTDATIKDQFYLFDPFSGAPPKAVVYGTSKNPTTTTKPTNLLAFKFYKQVNGYNIFLYRFDLNNASSTGINYYRNPVHPPYYWFARYSLTIDIVDSQGTRFNTTDAVNITDTDGYMRQFPLIELYKDSAYTQKTNIFRSTDNVWVSVSMFSVDPTPDTVTFGTVSVRDFLGGTQILKSFVSGRNSNPPLCPVVLGTCQNSPPPLALSGDGATITYRFRLNLSLANQDPWVDGSQNYAFGISYVDDLDETYGSLSYQLIVIAPLFRMDVVGGNGDTQNQAWGTHDYGYYYENLNGVDKWRKTRYEFCGLGASCKNSAAVNAVRFLDGDRDGDLDVAACQQIDQNTYAINYYRRDVDSDGNVVFTRWNLWTGNLACGTSGSPGGKIATGDLTGDLYPEIVVGFTNGQVWYFPDDGTWTSCPSGGCKYVVVDTTRGESVNGVTLGDFDHDSDTDIAVARSGGTVTYYLNLDGLGTFSTGGIVERKFAEAEITSQGTVVAPDFLRTYNSDDVWEQVQEAVVTEAAQSGGTSNPSVDAAQAPWTYNDWESGANVFGEWHNTGGNPNGLVDIHANFVASTTVSGYWYQSFTVSGSSPYTATVQFDRKVSQIVTGASVTVYVFVDATAGVPALATAIYTSPPQTGTTIWVSSGSISVPASRIPTAGTYYLKVAARVQNPASGSGTTITQFDNMQLTWSSTGGDTSELKHYWRLQQMPNRPLSSYTLRLEAHRSASSDGDVSFPIAYATDVTGGDPTTGTYASILWVNTTTDLVQTYAFPTSLQNLIVWIRVIDYDHHVGNTTLDSVFVDQMYIEINTQTIQPGAVITLPPTPGNAISIDADDQNGDGYFDIVVGTSNGFVYKAIGFAGGLTLQPAAGCFYALSGSCTTSGSAIVGIKLANITSAGTGLEIVLAYQTTVRVVTGSGPSGAFIVTVPLSGDPITAVGAGDTDGDGDDDIVVSTGQGNPNGPGLISLRNLAYGTGASWSRYDIEPSPIGSLIAIWDLDLGDGNKSQYLGR